MKKADKKKKWSGVNFREIKINEKYGDVLNRIYYIIEDDKSDVMENFRGIESNIRDKTIDLISKMATIKDFKSPFITNHLKGYNYGEIRPKPHRFFFFRKLNNNIIFFGYVLKKKNSLKDIFYKRLNEEKERYEREFEKFICRN